MQQANIKQTQWQSIVAFVGSLTDARGQPVDPGIREAVAGLLALGFPTDGSCAGHLDHGVTAPWIDIGQNLPERFFRLFAKVGLPHQPGKPPQVNDVFATYPELRALYQTNLRRHGSLHLLLHALYRTRLSPQDARLVLRVIGCYGVVRLISHGARLQAQRTPQQREIRLRLYQQEMQAFAAFCKMHYFAATQNEPAGAHR